MSAYAITAMFICCAAMSAKDTAYLKNILDDAAKKGVGTVEISEDVAMDSDLVIGPEHSGITLRGKNGAKIIFARKIDSWTRDGNLLKARLPDAGGGVLSLFVNGRRAQNAYLPKGGFFWSAGKCPVDASVVPDKGFYALPLLVRPNEGKILRELSESELKDAYLQMFCVWNEFKFALASRRYNREGFCALTLISNENYNTFRWDSAPRFRLVNIKRAISEEGEFYFDSANRKIFYLPRKGENEGNIEAYYSPKAAHIVVMGREGNPVKNFTLENLRFENAAQQRKPNGAITLMGQAAHEANSLIKIRNAENISVRSCDFKNIDPYAVHFGMGCKDSKIEGCAFASMGSGAVRVGENWKDDNPTEGISIRNNAVVGYGEFNMAGVALFVQDAAKVSVDGNTIRDGFYTGVSVGWTWGFGKTTTRDMSVRDNLISGTGKGWLDDMGGIYTLGACPGSIISGNDISGTDRHRYGGWGIYSDEGSSGWIIENNHVRNCRDDSYFMHYGRGIVVRNNIFEDSKTSQVGLGRVYDGSFEYAGNVVVFSEGRVLRNDSPIPPKAVKFAKNIYWQREGKPLDFGGLDFEKWKSFGGRDEGSIIENPNLQNYSAANPALKKIGFKPFKLGDAGADKEVLSRAMKLAEGRRLIGQAPSEPDYSPYGATNSTNYPTETVGRMPANIETPPDADSNAIIVKSQDRKKFIRLSSNEDKTKRSQLIFRFKAPKNEVRADIELRLTPDSDLTAIFYRGKKSEDLKIFKGGLKFGEISDSVSEFDQWLNFHIEMHSDGHTLLEISRNGRIIKKLEGKTAGEGPFSSLVLSAPKGGNAHADVGNVQVGPDA